MKLVILLIMALSTAYVVWSKLSKPYKKVFKKTVFTYLPPLALIVVSVFGALVSMFYSGSINIL